MYDNTLFWLIGIAATGWWYWNKQKREKEREEAAHRARIKAEGSAPVSEAPAQQHDEFLASVEEYAKRKAGEVQSAAEQYEKELEEKYSKDLEKKQRLSEFAQDHQLDRALIAVWEEVKYYPAWSKRDDFQQWNKLDVSDCDGSEEKNDRDDIKKVSFSYGGRKYEITRAERWLFDGDKHADFILSENGGEVFGINTSVEHEEGGVTYRCFDISIFKRKGEWFKFLLDAWKITKLKGKKQSADFDYLDADKIKGNFEE
jgi:hypothetical protein